MRAGNGVWQVVISPDGRHAYGIAYSTHALLIFDRDLLTGALTQRGAGGCLSETGSDGSCVRAKGLLYPVGITISPDGRNVYVASPRTTADGDAYPGGGVAMFTRNPASGDLSQPSNATACVSFNTATGGAPTTPGACSKGRGMTGVATVSISPDGRHVYAGGHSIAVLDRDPTSGVLTQPAGESGCFNEVAGEGCTPARGLAANMNMRQIAISPDSRSVYVPDEVNSALAILDRDPASGRLTQKPGAAGCFGVNSRGSCALEAKLGGARSAVVSPDGNQVYVSTTGAMLVFARAGDGQLSPQSCISDPTVLGCDTSGRNISDLTFSAISPDGQALVASNQSSGFGYVIFDRDGAGNLTQPGGIDGCVTADGAGRVRGTVRLGECTPLGTQFGHGTVSFHGDGSLTVASHYGSSITAFKRDLYPVCQNQSVAVPQNTTAPLGFACGDRNGDPMTFEVTRPSLSGSLGAVDQASGRVFYSPFANYLGGDALTYRAFAGGSASNEATLAVDVVVPATPRGPAAKARTVTSPVTYSWSVRRTRLTLRQLVVRRLPVGATVTLTCSGKRCPFKKRTVKRSRKSTMNVLNAKSLKGRKTFRAGQTVDIRVEVPGMNTKLLRFKLRTGKVPKHRAYCVPVGAKRAQRTCS